MFEVPHLQGLSSQDCLTVKVRELCFLKVSHCRVN